MNTNLASTHPPAVTRANQRSVAAAAPAEPLPSVVSKTLFGAHRQIYIRHGDAVYQLRITAQDKLILTK